MDVGKAEVANDDAAKGGKAAVGDVDGDVEQKQNPRLRVDCGFECLMPFPFSIGDSGFVFRKPLHGVVLLSVIQEESVHR